MLTGNAVDNPNKDANLNALSIIVIEPTINESSNSSSNQSSPSTQIQTTRRSSHGAVDFEMLVLENGHLTDTQTTLYYFYAVMF